MSALSPPAGITLAAADVRYVNIPGDTMTGTLIAPQIQGAPATDLVLAGEDGTAIITLSGAFNIAEISASMRWADNIELILGGSSDFNADWSTGQATAHSVVLGVPVGSATAGGNVLLVNSAFRNNDFDHVVAANPTFIVHSATDPDTANNQFVAISHDQTNVVISTGTGIFLLNAAIAGVDGTQALPAYRFSADGNTGLFRVGADQLGFSAGNVTVLTLDGRTVGNTGVTISPFANTTGSPTTLLVTGAAHTTLTASAEAIDINFNLARTVQFATGALATQRAMLVQAPTYAFVGASVVTLAATFAISGAPIAGTNATINSPLALHVEAGVSRFGGLIERPTTSAITASTTQTQGNGALTSEVNEISVVANTNDTITFPPAVAGRRVIIINNGANTLQYFPASGDDHGAGVDTVATLIAGSRLVFTAFDSTTWENI